MRISERSKANLFVSPGFILLSDLPCFYKLMVTNFHYRKLHNICNWFNTLERYLVFKINVNKLWKNSITSISCEVSIYQIKHCILVDNYKFLPSSNSEINSSTNSSTFDEELSSAYKEKRIKLSKI